MQNNGLLKRSKSTFSLSCMTCEIPIGWCGGGKGWYWPHTLAEKSQTLGVDKRIAVTTVGHCPVKLLNIKSIIRENALNVHSFVSEERKIVIE